MYLLTVPQAHNHTDRHTIPKQTMDTHPHTHTHTHILTRRAAADVLADGAPGVKVALVLHPAAAAPHQQRRLAHRRILIKREKEKESEGEKESKRERGRERERECVRECVFLRMYGCCMHA
jgi:hypothetical protein